MGEGTEGGGYRLGEKMERGGGDRRGQLCDVYERQGGPRKKKEKRESNRVNHCLLMMWGAAHSPVQYM